MTIPPITRPMFGSLRIASTGLSAQRARMEVIAQNLANIETTRTPEGGPYKRQVMQIEAEAAAALPTSPTIPPLPTIGGVASPSVPPIAAVNEGAEAISGSMDTGMITGGVRLTGIAIDQTEGPMVYDPGHPDADRNGYVRMPNVNMTDELMDLMNARRIYEANATVFQVAKAMLNKAIEI